MAGVKEWPAVTEANTQRELCYVCADASNENERDVVPLYFQMQVQYLQSPEPFSRARGPRGLSGSPAVKVPIYPFGLLYVPF
jgi:hypothetical protein